MTMILQDNEYTTSLRLKGSTVPQGMTHSPVDQPSRCLLDIQSILRLMNMTRRHRGNGYTTSPRLRKMNQLCMDGNMNSQTSMFPADKQNILRLQHTTRNLEDSEYMTSLRLWRKFLLDMNSSLLY